MRLRPAFRRELLRERSAPLATRSLAIGAEDTASGARARLIVVRPAVGSGRLAPPAISGPRVRQVAERAGDGFGQRFAGHAAAACQRAEHHVDLVGDCGDFFRRGSFPADEARRRAPERRLRIGDAVRHLAIEDRQAGLGELGADVLGDDGVARGLRQHAAKQRPAAIGCGSSGC